MGQTKADVVQPSNLGSQTSKKCVWRPVLSSALRVPWPELSEDCGVKILEALLCLIETMANPLSSLDDDAGRQDAPQAGHQQRHPGFGRGHKRIRLDGRRNPRQESIAMNDWSVEPMKVDHTHAIGLFSKDERLSSPVNTNLVQETPQLSASLANTMEDVMTTQPVACPPIHPASKVPPNSMKRSQSDPKSPTPSFKYQNSKSSEASQTKPKSSPDKRPRKSFDQSDRPQSRDHILLGIKAIGRMLEYQVIHKKSSVSNPKTSVSNPKLSEPSKLRWPYVFVCREDLNPSSLVDHLPVTVACFNEMHSLQSDVDYLGPPVQTQDVYLIPLPRGSDAKLSKALGVRRTAAVAISDTLGEYNQLDSLIKNLMHRPPSGPWLKITGPTSPQSLAQPARAEQVWIPTCIKHYKSTAPVDMKKHKLEKAQRRRQTKISRKRWNLHGSEPTPLEQPGQLS